MLNLQLEILEANYWENFKFAKDLSLIFPVDNPKRKKLESELTIMLEKINDLKCKKKMG